MKHLSIIPIIVLMVLGNSLLAQSPTFDVIYQRMYEKYLDRNPSQNAINGLMALMAPDGSFINLNYKATDGSPRKHVQNLITLANAYQNSQNALYRNSKLRDAYLTSLRFWVETDNQAKNWWYRFIPYPKELSVSVILMSKEISQDQSLYNKTIDYLNWSYQNAQAAHMTGANAADIIMGSLAASILTHDDARMKEYRNRMTQLLVIQEKEGIMRDYLYAQHCGHGRQLYFTNYGKEYVNSVLSYLEFCKDTEYQSPGAEILSKLFSNGVQWIFFGKHYDPNNAGRFIESERYAGTIKALAERVYGIDHSEEMKRVVQRIGGENTLEGNRMFWRFDYMVHRRNGYLTSARMTSSRTVGNEAGNGDGNFNYYAGNGVNYLMVTGHEYDNNFFKRFNNRQYPGITAEQDNDPLPIPDWGMHGPNGNDFAGGVSDSLRGAGGMILNRRGLQAHKAWFFFDNEYVCLGSGINTPEGKAEVFTTLNQCNRNGKIQYAAAGSGKAATLKKGSVRSKAEWIWHGKVGYFNLQPETEYVLACDTALFSLNVNHGIRPQDATYAYLVCPNLNNAASAAQYAQGIPVKILANTTEMQAVRHEKEGITEVIFYQAGELKLENGDKISVDAPCALLWNEKLQKVNIGNPRCESSNPESIHVTLTIGGKPTTLQLALPQGDMAGCSVSAQMGS